MALRLIRFLRWLPGAHLIQAHLDDCAAWEILYRPVEGGPPLNVRHVLGLEPLPKRVIWPGIEVREGRLH